MKHPSHPLYHKVCSLMDFFSLNQVVTDYTHTSPCGNTSLIDLALTSSPAQTVTCDSIPPLANSDHNGLDLNVSLKSNIQHARTNRRTVWRYAHADFSKANRLISEMDWDSLYCADIDQHCMQWQNMFSSIMEQCIPKKVLPPKRRNRPWLNKSIIQSIRRRNAAHKRAKNSNCPTLTARYRHIRNKVSSKLRQAKRRYFSSINPSNPSNFGSL